MTKIVGITGGIGSGKTTLVQYIESMGIPVYIADDQAKMLMNVPETVNKIQSLFDVSVIIKDNVLDRKKIAELVFKNANLLDKLNKIVHPIVQHDFEQFVLRNQDCPVVVKEAAILFESGGYKQCDATILITAPLETRIERVMSRDGVKREEILERINNQWPDEEKKKLATYIVENTDLQTAKSEINQIFSLNF